jgi:RHS repeat-associated protein
MRLLRLLRARPRGSINRSAIALLAATLLLTDVGASMSALSTKRDAVHHAQPAPRQAWGSAAGQPHLAGSPRRRPPVPKTLRSRYPLRPAAAAPQPKPNRAEVTPAPARPARFDPRASRLLPERHGAYDRTYANPDGNLTTELSTEPVNYRRPDGSWAPIDTRLVPQDDAAARAATGGWRNAADAVGVRLAGRADTPELASLAVDGGHAVGFGLADAAGVAGRVKGSTVTYPDALPGVDLRLAPVGGGLKETLVLRSAKAPRSFEFPLRLTGLSAAVVDGQVVLTDSAGQRRAVIPAGFMTDSTASAAGPATSTGVAYRLVQVNGQPALRVTLDGKWLDAPGRRYPVLVDPSVTSAGADSGLVVRGGSSTSGSSELLVGNVGGSPSASYVKFAGLVGQLTNHTIFGAQLQVVNYDAPSCSARPVTVHPVTQSWTSSSSFAYPGPSVGAALASSSFAYGFIPIGQSTSACPAKASLIDLGAAGRKLVQGWVDGQANNGLSLRASTSDSLAWKRLAGTGTANAPRLYVTHSPYNAAYKIPNPVPVPPVLQNQNGVVKVTVTNLSAATWTPSTYYLAYRAYNASTGKAVTQQRAANLTGNVARGAKVTLDATIKALPPGKYHLDFTMVHTGGPVFTDEQVPPARITLQVFDIPPVVQELYPPNGYQAQTLTPQLWARAVDIDAPPGSSLQYKFEVCEQDSAGNPVTCTTSAYQTSPAWTVTAGRLSWSKAYLWRAFVKDATSEVPSPRSALLTAVPQPEVTSHLAGAPYGTPDREFDPQVGNFSTAAVDAPVTTIGPELTLVRTYNSLDPRRDLLFGAGWSTRYDMRVVPDNDGSGNLVVTYPDGQEVRFGKNPDGTFAAPQGRVASLTPDGSGGWKLADKSGTTYQFVASGRLTKISDAASHSIVLTYNTSDGKLAKAQVSNSQTNTAGRALQFIWSGTHVAEVRTDPVNGAPLSWTYTYTGDLLNKVCAPGSACTTYAYAPGSHYRSAVADDRPDSYWRLGESQGTGAASDVLVNLGKDRGEYKNGVTLGQAGALPGTSDTAASFNGSSHYVDLPKGTLKKSRDAAVELWFKVPNTSPGGPLVGYQDKAVGQTSTLGVPLLYVANGRLYGQFWTGAVAPIAPTKLVNDGAWHHAVLSSMGATQTLYLDGVSVGTLANPASVNTSALTFNQVGAAYASSPASWPGWGGTAQRYLNGLVDEVALYSHPLGPAAVAAHYKYGTQAADQVATVTLPSGRVAAQVDYDTGLDRVKEYTDRNGGTWRLGAPMVYGGDTDLRRGVELRDPGNRLHLYEYDALVGRLIRQGDPLGESIRDEDKAIPPTTTATTAPPTTTCTNPDPGDPQFCTTIPPTAGGPVFEGHNLDGIAIRTYAYDAQGFPKVITNENGDSVTLGYDSRGNTTSRKTCRTLTQCFTEYYTYSTAFGPLDPRSDLPTEYRDARSASAADNTYRTSYSYTSTGELASQTNPDGGVVSHRYSNGGELAVGGGSVPTGLVLETTDPRSAKTQFAYYQNGDLARVTEPTGLVTEFTYDALGRKLTEKETSDAFPGGVTTTYTYDGMSRLLTTTEPATADAVTGVTHQGRTVNTYDADGNLSRVDAADVTGHDPTRATTFDYDGNGRVERVTDAEGKETSYGYDRFGNRTFSVDANGNRLEYGYTARNMLAEVRVRDWNGDPPGSGPPSPGDWLVLHSYAYDFAGRLVSDTDAMGRKLAYAYYNDDLLKSITLKGFHDPNGSTRDYVVEADTYDAAGNLTRQEAGNGKVVTQHTVTKLGQVDTTTVDPGGLSRKTDLDYDLAGNVTKATTSGNASNVPWAVPATSEVVDYTYDLAGNLTKETEVSAGGNRVTTHGYDQRGLRTSTTDPRGNVTGADPAAFTTSFAYDELGRQTKMTAPPVSAESNGGAAQSVRPVQLVGYDTFDEQVAVKDELGSTSRVDYDKLGRPTKTTAPSYTPPGGTAITPTTLTRYDAVGNVAETEDGRGNVTRYTYDRLNRMATRDEPATTNAERAVWRYTYTRTGEVLSVTDPTGGRVEATYDDLDRQLTMTQVERRPTADNFTTRYGYDDAGNLKTVTAPTGPVANNDYDAIGELIKATDPAGVPTHYGYDFAGRQVRISDGLGRTSRTDYDALGRMTSESDLSAGGQTLRSQSYDYDPAGNLSTATDPLGDKTTYEYDALNQLTRQVEPVTATKSITTSFGYDAAGNRSRYTDGRGNKTIYTVNSLGLPESVIEPSTTAYPAAADRTWTAGYDANAQPVKLTAPGAVTRIRTFDAAGRLSGETGAGAEAGTAARTLSYDLADRLTKASAPGGDNVYTYDDRGQVLTATGPSGTASFEYDGDGNLKTRTDAAGTSSYGYVNTRLSTRTDGITNTTQTTGYDAAGQPASIDYGAGRVRGFGYDNLGRPDTDTLKNSANQTVASIDYDYDLDDRLTRKATTGTAGAGVNTYTYDKDDRLTSWTKGATTTQYDWDDSGNRVQEGAETATFDERNRLKQEGSTTYSYSPRGTLKSKTTSGQTENLSFDAFDRLITQGAQSYAYDGLDRLASRGGTTFAYSGPGDEVVSDGTLRYARGPDEELLSMAEGASLLDKRLALTDQHGDTVGDFDPANTTLGALRDSTAFDPFGQPIATTGERSNLGFQGDWTDPASGQVNMGARWYDPATGRFDSRDDTGYTVGASILANRYAYAAGDPLDHVDADGRWPSCSWCKKAVSTVASAVSTASRWVSTAASYVYRGVTAAARWAWSGIKAVGRAISSAARWVYSKAKSIVGAVGRAVVSAGRWLASRSAAVANWARARAEAARRAAIARARAITYRAKQAVAWAVRHNPVPAIKAALRPVYAGLKKVVSATAHLPAAVVATARNVVRDAYKSVQVVYQQAVQAAGAVVENVSTALQAVSEVAQSALPMVAGIAAGALTTAGCLAITGGAGSAACIVAGFAVGSAVTSALSCAPGQSIAGCAARGAVTGAIGGAVFVATGGLGSGLSAAIVAGGASSAATSATEQLVTTGRVDASQVLEQGVVGAATGGIARGLARGLPEGRAPTAKACAVNSFVPGTAVLMADGTRTAIQDVRVGDKVQATDPTTDRTEAKPVTDVITGSGKKHLVEITVDTDGDKGKASGKLTATDGHPFWLPDRRRWADAKDLRPGDLLRTSTGTHVQVSAIRRFTRSLTVYNLTVDGIHTYHVAAGGQNVLVHNCPNGAGNGGSSSGVPEYDPATSYSSLSWKIKTRVFKRMPMCAYCGRNKSTTVDHIRSKKQDWFEGGWEDTKAVRSARVNDDSNLTGACKSCNSSKGDLPLGRGRFEWWPFEWGDQWWRFRR